MTATDTGLPLATPGSPALVNAVAAAVKDLLGNGGPVTVAIGCAGGRRRSPVVAGRVARRLEAGGTAVTVGHRDMGKPVVSRAHGEAI